MTAYIGLLTIYNELNNYCRISTNQISIAPIYTAKPGSVAQQLNLYSALKLMKQFCNINRPLGVLVSIGERPSQKRCVLRCFLKVATEMAERADSGRFFQGDLAQKWKTLAPCDGLDPRDWLTNSIVWSQWTGWEWCGKHGVKLNRLFSRRVL